MRVSARSGYSAAAGAARASVRIRLTTGTRIFMRALYHGGAPTWPPKPPNIPGPPGGAHAPVDITSDPAELRAFDDVQAAVAVDEIHEAARVVADVVAADAAATGRVGNERRDLARRVRVGDVDDAQAVREPRDGNLRAAYLLARLVSARELRLRRAVDAVDLEAGERCRARLVRDVHEPEERRRPRRDPHHVLVRHEQHAPPLQRERDGERRVRRRAERWAPVETGHEARLAHVLDVEDDEAAVPVRDVEPVAEADRMVAAVRAALPGRRLAAGDPLAGHPPAADLLRVRRIVQVEDADDVAAITAVEGEAVDTLALPERDLARLVGTRDVEDAEAAAEAGARRGARRRLPVHEHHVVHHTDLVGVHVGRDRDLGELARLRRVADVDHRGAVRRLHVGDVRRGAADDDLAAARAIEVADRFDASRLCHGSLRV